MKRKTGKYKDSIYVGKKVKAFVPYPLPPEKLELDKKKLEHAEQQLKLLNMASNMVLSEDMLIYSFVKKEAVSTSQVLGIQTTIADLFRFESNTDVFEDSRILDVQEVCNYLAALRFAVREIKRPCGLPISKRLLNDTHRTLIKGHRGQNKKPGILRRDQNCLAGGMKPRVAVFYPPPSSEINALLDNLEKYIHNDTELHPLVRAGLVHVQFETIHPYLDGNGRLGRLLIVLLLMNWKLLDKPILYLSLFFKRNRNDYYRLLNEVRTKGNWEEWIDFFLDGVSKIAIEAAYLIAKLNRIIYRNRSNLYGLQSFSIPAARLFELLPQYPIITIKQAKKKLSVTHRTASKAIDCLVEAKILVESTGKKKYREFVYQDYVHALEN